MQAHTHTIDPNALPTATTASQPHLFSTKPLWMLLLAFDAMLLHPNKENKGSPNDLVRARLKAFRAGHIQSLWTASQAKPKQTTPSLEDHNHQAQLAADEDNYRTAFARLTKAMPVAAMTPENQHRCSKLYVDKKPYQPTRRSARTTTQPFSLVNTEVLLRALQKVNSGTAAGPNGDFPAVLKDYALHQPNPDSPDYRPNLSVFADITQLLVNNQLHPELQTYFSSNWFMALHKDSEDKTKLRPIGMGTAYRRITGKYLMMLLDEEIAKVLTPHGQWGIAVRGGIDFMIHTSRVLVERYLKPNTESRTAIALDLVNCWNNASREAAQDELAENPTLQQLLPFTELLYDHDVPCWYSGDQGTIQSFLQKEGHCQGCPMAPTLSCLSMLKLLRPLQAFLTSRAEARKLKGNTGDDGNGTQAAILAYFDDMTSFLAPEDVLPTLQFIQQHGAPLGIHINWNKTKLLTTTTGNSVTTRLTPAAQSIQEAIAYMQEQAQTQVQPEVTTGLRLLGQPLGSTDFANQFLQEALARYRHNLQRLKEGLQDRHTQSLLFRCCSQPSLTHLLNADVYYNAPTQPAPNQGLFNWTSPFIAGVQDANSDFLAFLASYPTTDMPTLTKLIANMSSSKGGFGLRDPSTTALPLMLISFTRSLQMALKGSLIGNRQDRLPMTPSFSATFQAWLTSNKRPFTLYRNYATLLLQGYAAVKLHKAQQINSITDILQMPLQGLSPKLYDHHTSAQLEAFTDPETNPQDAALFPSIMSTLTSFPLTLHHRQHPHNRLANQTFQTLLQRKLRLPLSHSAIPLTGTCPLCKVRQLDPHGDHLLSCQKISKTAFHNTIRNTLYHVCKKLAPQANMVSHPTAISIETPIANTSLRPADVGIRPLPDALQTTPSNPVVLLALDVTITSSPSINDRPSPPNYTHQQGPH